MTRITDMTLTCIEGFGAPAAKLRELLALLILTGADIFEIPGSLYLRLGLKPSPKYLLRIDSPDEAELYPGINRFISRKSGFAPNPLIISEVQMNDVREINFLSRYDNCKNLRIVGLDDVICHDYETVFAGIRKRITGRVEFCPENSLGCASAAALEWVVSGGIDLAVSFGGIGNKAPLEETLLALRIVKRHRPSATYEVFPQISKLMEEITGEKYPCNKPVIGDSIFKVESGIHIDGILKKPEMYEPFAPELVGGMRQFIIGKHSGKKSLRIKLSENGIDPDRIKVSALLDEVRVQSVKKMSGLTDSEFLTLAEFFRR